MTSLTEIELNQIEKVRDHVVELRHSSTEIKLIKLKLLKKVILEEIDEINLALAADFHKPYAETMLAEIMPVIAAINDYEKNLKKWNRVKKVSSPLLLFGTKSYIRREAKGLILIISPWNYPFQLSLYPLITCYAAGNGVVLKPSEETNQTNKIIRKIIEKVFSENEVAMIEGNYQKASQLLDLSFDHIFFTGSTRVGKIVMEKAAKNLTSVTLELGGKSPVIVDQQVKNHYDVFQKILWGKFLNSGQTCVAPDFIFLHKSHLEDFKSSFLKIYELFLAPENSSDLSLNPSYTHLINSKHSSRLKILLDEAKRKGGEVVSFGNTFERKADDCILPPTLILNADFEMQVMKEEIFGPILPVIIFDQKEEVVNHLKNKEVPLALYLFGSNDQHFKYYLNSLSSGGVCINDTLIHLANPKLPFGGNRGSGLGAYHGEFGFNEVTNPRAILRRHFNSGTKYFYPPYTKFKVDLIKKIIQKFSRFF